MDEMAAAIISERGIPREELGSWRWSRIKRNYQGVVRGSYDKFMLHEQAAEVGTYRALQGFYTKHKPKPLPKAEQVVKDIFALPEGSDNPDWLAKELARSDSAMSPIARARWQQYMDANHLASWDDGGKGAHSEIPIPDELIEAQAA